MLKLVDIKKDYLMSDETVHALKGVSTSFRKNEFVSILGPSGCGKTTLLNIIGGLDRYTSGDLIINGKSTKDFKDKDWDTYRNHSIGFVFQTYNLIMHISVLANVELALTIAGVSKSERRQRAYEALEKVGLSDKAKKKPNQLSGGQMQRVAIARALINNPDILLADEPTGALDSETSIQIMELLKEVAKDRLVIMVTHNPDLADKYSSRILHMKDGEIYQDSNPCFDEEIDDIYQPVSYSKMKLKTSFGLSFRNLISKFKRTALVVVAGSIGIIGVSTVLAVSNGVKSYIGSMEDDMLSGNPITIEKSAVDVAGLMSAFNQTTQANAVKESIVDGKINIDSMIEYLVSQKDNLEQFALNNTIDENYVRFINQMPKEYFASMKYEYGIDFKLNFYTSVNMTDKNNIKNGVNRTVTLKALEDMYTDIVQKTNLGEYASIISLLTDTFYVSPDSEEYIKSQYNLLAGDVAKNEDEMMIVVSKDRELTDIFLGQLGYYTQDEFVALINKNADKSPSNPYNDVSVPTSLTYKQIMDKEFYYVPYNDNDNFVFPKNNLPNAETIFDLTGGTQCIDSPFKYNYEVDNFAALPVNAKKIKITGILQPKNNVSYGCLETGFVVSDKFQKELLNDSKNSYLAEKIKQCEQFYQSLGVDDGTKDENRIEKELKMKKLYSLIVNYSYQYDYSKAVNVDGNNVIEYASYTGEGMPLSVLNVAGGAFGGAFSDVISKLFGNAYSIDSQFEKAIRSIGGIKDIPTTISIYPTSFDEKYLVTDYLNTWNDDNVTITLNATEEYPDVVVLTKDDRERITYNDNLELIISLIGTMIDIITIALLVFTSLALVVSTVMIGVITYVSVVERIKEIGIIRSLGGRKKDISNLFNAETFIIGLSAGLFGVGITYLFSAIINLIINIFAPIGSIILLPPLSAVIVILVSIGLTLISGLLPARAAAKKDPVIALRTE